MSLKCFILISLVFDLIVIVLSRKTALEHFISKMKIDNYKITILDNDLYEINRTWIEYQYNFKEIDFNLTNIDDTSNNSLLTIYFNKFDCENSLVYYTQELLNILQEYELYMYTNISNNEDGNIDLIVCNSNENLVRDNYHPHEILKSRYAIIYKKRGKPKDIFVQTFVGTLWLCFLAVLLCLAICLRITTYYYSHIYRETRLWTWVEITLWAVAAACQQGFSYTPPRSTSRMLFFLGYLTAYVSYTAFTAAITSVLVQQENVPINIDDFKIIAYQCESFYGDRAIGSYKIASHVNNLEDLFNKIEEQANIGIGPQVLLEHYININMLYGNNYKLISLDEKTNGEYKSNLWLKNGLSDQTTINFRLARLQETGILKALKQKSLMNVFPSQSNEGYSSASLEHVKSAILLFLSGILLSALFLIMELGIYGYRYRATE